MNAGKQPHFVAGCINYFSALLSTVHKFLQIHKSQHNQPTITYFSLWKNWCRRFSVGRLKGIIKCTDHMMKNRDFSSSLQMYIKYGMRIRIVKYRTFGTRKEEKKQTKQKQQQQQNKNEVNAFEPTTTT